MITNITYPYKTNYAELPGTSRVAYIDEGKGEKTLLFIHGLANYALVWKKNIDHLKQHYRCIAIDLPGNGLSDRNPHPFGMKFFAETIYQFIDALKLKNIVLVGHSMGGQVAMTAVIDQPQCADALVLCAPAGFEEFSSMDKTLSYNAMHLLDFISSDEHTLRQTVEHSFYRYNAQGETVIKDLVALIKSYSGNYYRKMVDACIKGMMEEPVYSQVNRIQQNTLLIFGSKDGLIPNKLLHHTTTTKLAENAVKKLPNATLKMIPDCGHFVQWEKADDVNSYIHSFVG